MKNEMLIAVDENDSPVGVLSKQDGINLSWLAHLIEKRLKLH